MTRNEIDKSNILGVEVETYVGCDFCKSKTKQPQINIPWSIWSEWLYISECMGGKEWGAVFWVKDDTITHYKIPQQEVSATECEFKEELGGDGMVHSHHSMGAFHSGQDDKQARNLYTYSIVLSKENSICTKREKLPCKGFGYRDTQIMLVEMPKIDLSVITEPRFLRQGFVETSNSQVDKWGKITQEDVLSGPCDTCRLFDCENCEEYAKLANGNKAIY